MGAGARPQDRLRDGPLRPPRVTLEVVSCERIFDEAVDGVWASDHFGVVADFRALVPGGGSVL
jgi:hypothetical protein